MYESKKMWLSWFLQNEFLRMYLLHASK